MRLLVYGKQVKEKDLEVIQELFDCLVEEEIDIFIYEPYLRELESKANVPAVAHSFEKFEDFRAQRIDFCGGFRWRWYHAGCCDPRAGLRSAYAGHQSW